MKVFVQKEYKPRKYCGFDFFILLLYNSFKIKKKKNMEVFQMSNTILEKDIIYLVNELNISREDAIELIKFDSNIKEEASIIVEEKSPKAPAKKGGITEEELEGIKTLISAGFPSESFKNKDLSVVVQEELGITASALPSRLKRLVEQGFLEDIGGSPKSYKMVTS